MEKLLTQDGVDPSIVDYQEIVNLIKQWISTGVKPVFPDGWDAKLSSNEIFSAHYNGGASLLDRDFYVPTVYKYPKLGIKIDGFVRYRVGLCGWCGSDAGFHGRSNYGRKCR